MQLTEKYKELEREVEINYSMISKYIDKEIYLESGQLTIDYYDIYNNDTSWVYVEKFLPDGTFRCKDEVNDIYYYTLDAVQLLKDRIKITEFLNELLKDKLDKILEKN